MFQEQNFASQCTKTKDQSDQTQSNDGIYFSFMNRPLKFPEVGRLYLMLSSVSSGIGATVCTAGRFLLVAPLTKFDEEVAEWAASGAPAGEITSN